MENLIFEVSWDEEAEVWYTSETPIQGVMAEAPTLEELSKKLSVIIPEVLAVDRETEEKATHSVFASSRMPKETPLPFIVNSLHYTHAT